jgi:N-carbamoyl-L-amino-acid hydrolase
VLTLLQINAATADECVALLDGTFEQSPALMRAVAARRPFATLAALKTACNTVLRALPRDAKVALLRAHPELAGKAMVGQTLTVESTDEQGRAGLADCTPEEFALLQRLNADYNAKFGWPFILAVRGPRGLGLHRREIIATFQRRLQGRPEDELAECLRNIMRIVELRLNDKFGFTPLLGQQAWDCAELLARHSEAAPGTLTVTYLTDAHRACQAQLLRWMGDCGFDETRIDAVGNVVGVYHGSDRDAPRLLTGSHFDTVRNGGRYDGRLGIFVPMIVVRELHRAGRRLKHGIELVAFAEEEGQRYAATFLGSSALTGGFDPAWLDQRDADGVTMREAMRAAGLPATMEAIAAEARDPAHYLGFVEVHIEQGPVLHAAELPLGVVTSINGSVRCLGEVQGQASHAGTTPMGQRRDAATAVAELALYVEQRATAMPHTVGTVGLLEVPQGSINVVPGRCRFSLDLRATTNQARDALAEDVRTKLQAICARRGLGFSLAETLRASAAPSAPAWQARWEAAVAALGLPVKHLPSGAGHDAMKLHGLMPQAMLFVRGEHGGISHNPLESSTADDMDLAVRAFQHLTEHLTESPA